MDHNGRYQLNRVLTGKINVVKSGIQPFPRVAGDFLCDEAAVEVVCREGREAGAGTAVERSVCKPFRA
jgi:hypothetical protein